MNETEHKIDRTGWPSGPWDGEPDRVDFKHAGLPCLMLRNRSGVWCGYAAVPPEHPWHGKDYSDRVDARYAEGKRADMAHVSVMGMFAMACSDDDGTVRLDCAIVVHGGLTYANACGGRICHVPEPGEPDNVWWFGFDCAHAGDLSPDSAAFAVENGWEISGNYCDQAYVRAETERLAEQLVEAANAQR